MTVSLTETMVVLEAVYRKPAFIQDFEDHISYILKTNRYAQVGIEPAMGLKFKGDFFGLLQELQMMPKTFYATMRLTGLVNPTDYDGSVLTIKQIDANYLESFVNVWRAHRREK